jgi:polyphenol oxidase
MTGKTRVLSTVSEEDTAKNLSTRDAYNRPMRGAIFVASDAPDGVLVAVSERGVPPPGTRSPTEVLSRRFVEELGVADLALVRATQVHGRTVVEVRDRPGAGETADAGECDALVTRLAGVGLVVQTADCVPVLLAAPGAVGAVHAGWRGAAAGVVAAAAEAFLSLADGRGSARAWLGPSIGACCYEVGGEVAQQFPGEFARPAGDGKHRLDLAAAVRAQLEAAGIPPDRITKHASCTMCGGETFASWRRDREHAGRMIALVARLG